MGWGEETDRENALPPQVINVFLSPEIPLKDIYFFKIFKIKKKYLSADLLPKSTSIIQVQPGGCSGGILFRPAGYFVVSTNVI